MGASLAARPAAAQLQLALNARVLVEQAKGVLMAREGVDAERAVELIAGRC